MINYILERAINSIYLVKLRVINPTVYKYFLQFKQSQFWDKYQLENYQFEMLKKTLTDAYETHEFYRELYDANNVSPDDFRCLEDIEKFPLVSKEQLIKGLKDNKFKLPSKILWHSTSGSTGEPFTFPIDLDGEKIRKACKMRTEEWYGKYAGTRWLRIWRGKSTTLKSRILDYLLARKIEIPFYQLDKVDENLIDDVKLQSFIDKINRSGVKIVDGYVSALTIIADFALRTNQKMKVNSVVTGAEYLSLSSRKIIETAFNANVFNRYGGTEIGLMAHEFTDGSLRIMADRLYHEALPLPGVDQSCEIVITDFTNKAMPFIRYKVGDLVSPTSSSSTSNSDIEFPILSQVDGRSNDFFVLPDGRLLTSHVWHVYFRDKKNVTRFQVIQSRDASISVKLETNGRVDTNKIASDLMHYVPGLSVSCEVVDSIPHQRNGKFRHTLSEMSVYENDLNKKFISPARDISSIAPYVPTASAYMDPDITMKLDWNESAIEVHDQVRKVVIETVNRRNALNWYPPVTNEKLKESLAKYCGVASNNVEVFPGSDSVIDFLCKIFVREGVVVGLVEPTYDQARLNFEIWGGSLKRYRFQDLFNPSLDELTSQINGDETVIYLSNPNNPTGFYWSCEQISHMISQNPSILFIVDEAYIEFADEGTCSQLVNKYNNIMVVRTFSKGLALAGLRIGFLIYPEVYGEIFSKIVNVKDVNTLALVAAQEILNTIDASNENIRELIAGRDYACEVLGAAGLEAINGKGNFFMLKSRNPDGLVAHLKDKNILVRSRDKYPGLKGYIRISSTRISEMKMIVDEVIAYEN